MGKGGISKAAAKAKGAKAKGKGSGEIFVCDYCLQYEGTHADVAQHEKGCKRHFEMLCRRAGTYVPGDNAIVKDEPAAKKTKRQDVEAEEGVWVPEGDKVSFGRSAKEKRQAAKERLRKALSTEEQLADDRLDEFESAHMERSTAHLDERPAAAPAPALPTRDASASADTRRLEDQGLTPQELSHAKKVQRRKAAKKKRKELKREATAAESAKRPRDEDDAAEGGASRAKLPKKEAAAERETKLRKGVRILELSAGYGPTVEDRKRVKVKYVGRLESSDGKIFDQGTMSFRLGKGEVIQGWDIGVQGMRVGAQRRITVPPAAGYGRAAVPGGKIPPNSTLCFDVAVLG